MRSNSPSKHRKRSSFLGLLGDETPDRLDSRTDDFISRRESFLDHGGSPSRNHSSFETTLLLKEKNENYHLLKGYIKDLRSQIHRLEYDNSKLSFNCSTQESKLQQKTAENSEFRVRNKQLEQDVTQLTNDIFHLKSECSRVELERDELQRRVLELESNLKLTERENEVLKQVIHQKQQLPSPIHTDTMYQKSVEYASPDLFLKDRSYRTPTKDTSRSRLVGSPILEADITQLAYKEQKMFEAVETIEKHTQALQDWKKKLMKEVQKTKLENEQQWMKEHKEKMDRMAADYTSRIEKIQSEHLQEMRQLRLDYNQQLDLLRSDSNEERKKMERRMDQVQRESQALVEQIRRESSDQIEELRRSHKNEVKALQSKLESTLLESQEKIAGITEQYSREIAEGKYESVTIAEKSKYELELAKKKIAKLQKTNDEKTKSEKQFLTEQLTQHQLEIDFLTRKRAELKETIRVKEMEARSLQQQLEEQRENTASVTEQLTLTQQKIHTLQSSLQKSTEKSKNLEDELLEKERSTRELQDRIGSQRKTLVLLRSALVSVSKQVSLLKREHLTLRTSISNQLTHFSNAIIVNFFQSHVTTQIKLRDNKLNEFAKLIHQLEKEIDVVTEQRKRDLQESENRLHNLSNTLDELNRSTQFKDEEITSIKLVNKQRESEINGLRREIEDLKRKSLYREVEEGE